MQCCERVIVTVCIPKSNFSLDMELAAFAPIEELSKKMLETLRILNPQRFSSASGLRLNFNGKTLSNRDTLASQGIWDGTIIEISIE